MNTTLIVLITWVLGIPFLFGIFHDEMDEDDVWMIFLWPLVPVGAIICAPFFLLYQLGKWIVK